MKMKKLTSLTLVAAVAAFTLVGCGGSGGGGSDYTAHPYDAPGISESDKAAYLGAINNARATGRACGDVFYPAASPMSWGDSNYLAAYEHAEDLVTSGTYSHDGSGTESDWTAQVQELGRASNGRDRLLNNGWKLQGNSGGNGENIVAGRSSINAAVSAWLRSDRHCPNIMGSFQEGAGKVGVARVGNMWVMVATSY